jgi:hypothetical protein
VHENCFVIYPGLVEYFVYSSPSTKSPFLDCEPIDAEVDYPDVLEEKATTERGGVNYHMYFNDNLVLIGGVGSMG